MSQILNFKDISNGLKGKASDAWEINRIFEGGLDWLWPVSFGFWINVSRCGFEESPGRA